MVTSDLHLGGSEFESRSEHALVVGFWLVEASAVTQPRNSHCRFPPSTVHDAVSYSQRRHTSHYPGRDVADSGNQKTLLRVTLQDAMTADAATQATRRPSSVLDKEASPAITIILRGTINAVEIPQNEGQGGPEGFHRTGACCKEWEGAAGGDLLPMLLLVVTGRFGAHTVQGAPPQLETARNEP
jgi:hypothetical protein